MQASLTDQQFLSRADVRRYIAHRTARSVDDIPSVRFWRLAGRATLFGVLVYAGLQYYFLHVFVEILSLPSVTTFIGGN